MKWDSENTFGVEMVSSFYLPISRNAFKNIGGYDEQFPHAGAEDHDFAKRLNASGIKAFIAPKILVFHNEADRIDLKGWLNRKERGGETRRIAYELGHKDQLIAPGFIKSFLFIIIGKMSTTFELLLKMIPNIKMFDGVYFRLINLILGARLYKGFRKYRKS